MARLSDPGRWGTKDARARGADDDDLHGCGVEYNCGTAAMRLDTRLASPCASLTGQCETTVHIGRLPGKDASRLSPGRIILHCILLRSIAAVHEIPSAGIDCCRLGVYLVHQARPFRSRPPGRAHLIPSSHVRRA